jgi:hypothetical protein
MGIAIDRTYVDGSFDSKLSIFTASIQQIFGGGDRKHSYFGQGMNGAFGGLKHVYLVPLNELKQLRFISEFCCLGQDLKITAR